MTGSSLAAPAAPANPENRADELWVFGYGSLMWRPDFDFLERRSALVHGWRRSLCVYSHIYRGTPEAPGLVLGLDRGGACRGVAFRVAGARRTATLDYLRKRELVTAVYIERYVLAHLAGGAAVSAVTYVADRRHPQYAGKLEREELLWLVTRGRGQSGPNAEYVLNTEAHLRESGVADPTLDWLAAQLRRPM